VGDDISSNLRSAKPNIVKQYRVNLIHFFSDSIVNLELNIQVESILASLFRDRPHDLTNLMLIIFFFLAKMPETRNIGIFLP